MGCFKGNAETGNRRGASRSSWCADSLRKQPATSATTKLPSQEVGGNAVIFPTKNNPHTKNDCNCIQGKLCSKKRFSHEPSPQAPRPDYHSKQTAVSRDCSTLGTSWPGQVWHWSSPKCNAHVDAVCARFISLHGI